jgi:hypothetical protein
MKVKLQKDVTLWVEPVWGRGEKQRMKAERGSRQMSQDKRNAATWLGYLWRLCLQFLKFEVGEG